jgi:hypothetical protein
MTTRSRPWAREERETKASLSREKGLAWLRSRSNSLREVMALESQAA